MFQQEFLTFILSFASEGKTFWAPQVQQEILKRHLKVVLWNLLFILL